MLVSGKSWIVILICALAVSLVFISEDTSNVDSQNLLGFAAHPLYDGFSTMTDTFDLYSDLVYGSTNSYKTLQFSLSDDVVYKTAYVSINGNAWQPFALTGTAPISNWFRGYTTGTVNISTSQVPNGVSANNYIAIYSCSRNGAAWDCNDNQWQISTFTTLKASSTYSLPYVACVTADNYDITNNALPTHTVDNNISDASRWSGYGNGAWIKYDFLDDMLLTGINILFYKKDSRISRFTLEYSLTGSSWTKIGDYSSSGTATGFETFRFNPVTAKYFRIVGHGNTEAAMENWTSIVEVTFTNSTSNTVSCSPSCTTNSYTSSNTCSSAGVCQPVCISNYGNCDGNNANGCETSLLTSASNCGSCGKTCTETCTNGICTPVQSGTTMKIFIIGDSTAAQYSSSNYPLTGWGMQLQQYFNSQNVVVVNNAVSGASSKSYSTSSTWTNTYNSMNNGDYLFIQFGHNDEHADAEGTSPYTTYQDYLQVYIDGARAKGVYPVLLTPVERNIWSGSLLTNSHGEYPAAMIALAQEQNVPIIDMTTRTRTLYNSLGQAVTTNSLFMNFAAGVYQNYPSGSSDNSHYQVRGANETAKLVIDGINGLGSSSTVYRLVPYIKSTTKGTGKTYYLSPSGSDQTGNGSITKPWFTLTKAWTVIAPGDTIYMRGGTYIYASRQQLTGKAGTTGNLIRVWAYPGETPNLTISNPLVLNTWPYSLVYFDGDYFHWKGLEISGIKQNPDSTGGGALRVESSNHNIFELFNIHDNGFAWHINAQSTDNLILNCDVYNIYDPYSTSKDSTTGLEVADPYEDGDGFSIGYDNGGTFNTFRGCRAWNIADDGWDLWRNEGEVLIENCWTWKCGYAEDGISEGGNGQGFKFGISDTTGTNVLVTARNTVSAYNRQSGYHQNGMLHPVALYNSIAYANGAQGFWFGGWSTSEYSYGIKHILTNNIEYKNRYKSYLTTGSVLTTNTFLVTGNNNSNYIVTDADFVSLDESQLLRPRKADGSLPDIDFLKLRSDSDLVNKGVAVSGRTTDGAGKSIIGAPDLGPFETG